MGNTRTRPWLRPICWIAGHRPDPRKEYCRVVMDGAADFGRLAYAVQRLGPLCRICLRCGAFVEKAK